MSPQSLDPMAARAMEILLVEDNYGDVRLTMEALKDCRVPYALRTVEDGISAMSYLRREGAYALAPRPDIILLDLNVPRKDGREVLKEVKSDPSLKRIPVIVLSTSRSKKDVLMSYDLHANCFISKPIELDRFLELIKLVESFWLTAVELPRE